jgi:LPS export ABC transporter protein LptC
MISCTGDLDKTKKVKNTLPPRTDVGKEVEIYYSERSIKTALLHAPTLMKQEDSLNRTYFPDGIHVELFDSLGNLSSTLTAKYGEFDHTSNQMKARDSVKLISTNGKILKTNDLIWMQNENRMVSYGSVEIRNNTEVIYGDTLFGDENLKRYIVKKVRGVVHVSK